MALRLALRSDAHTVIMETEQQIMPLIVIEYYKIAIYRSVLFFIRSARPSGTLL